MRCADSGMEKAIPGGGGLCLWDPGASGLGRRGLWPLGGESPACDLLRQPRLSPHRIWSPGLQCLQSRLIFVWTLHVPRPLISRWLESGEEGLCCVCIPLSLGSGLLASPCARLWGSLLTSTLALAQGDPLPT